jgi:hypothetical protein
MRANSQLFLGALVAMLALTGPAAAQPPHASPRLRVEGLREAPGAVKLTDLQGHDLSTELQPRPEGGDLSVSLARPGPFIAKPSEIKHVALTGPQRLTLPGGVVMPLVAAPDGSGPARMTWFRPSLLPSPMPAVWDEVTREYVTRLTFGIERKSDAPVTLTLDQPVIFKLSYEGLTARELPPVLIDGSGLDHEKTIELRFQPRTAHPTLLVRSSITDTNVELQALPRLELRAVEAKILGFGLGAADVLIQHVQPYGERLPAPADLIVAIEVSGRAIPEPRQPSFKAGTADTMLRLRSAGLGPVTVRATANGVSGRTSIDQQFPAGPLLSALLGGTLGSLARRFVKRARPRKPARQILEGLLVATIAFVGGVLGVGYLGLPAAVVSTEAGAFLTGALTGFAGVMALETMTRRLLPKDSDSHDGDDGDGKIAARS